MILKNCPVRVPLRLTEVPIASRNQLRFQELGLRVGTQATIAQHAGYGGLILNVAGSRIAIDHNSAKLIQAEVIS
ncbi:MAG: FeoA family protein [Actinomycetaceae bacterium]|nr:ferrous iron transport protein A [Arcanobacterium sp.]MDD7504920.1 FeoA family protein [Actinomycetaceae bacterium]MDY6143266.1 FeoA family protein [Arcanobacterium sp.]